MVTEIPTDYLSKLDIKLEKSVTDEMAIPSYTHKNPIIRWLFKRRLYTIIDFCKYPTKGRVLDFGTGSGILLPYLSNNFQKVVGMDLHTDIAKAICEKYNLKNVELKKIKEKENLPKDKKFDLIICADVLEHVNDVDYTLNEFVKILDKGGHLIVSGPTESIIYKIGRYLAGFKNEYHHRDIKNIKRCILNSNKFVMKKYVRIPALIPLFEVFLFEKS